MIDSNSCQRKTVGLWQLVGLALYFPVSLYSLTTLVSPQHISEDAFPYPPTSLASPCVQSKIGSSLVSQGPHLWIIPTSSMYPVGPPSPSKALAFPSVSSFSLFSPLVCFSLHWHGPKSSPVCWLPLRCSCSRAFSLICHSHFLSILFISSLLFMFVTLSPPLTPLPRYLLFSRLSLGLL